MIKLQKELTPEQFEEQILKPLGQKVSDIETHLTNALEMHTLSSRQRTLAFLLWQTNEVMYKRHLYATTTRTDKIILRTDKNYNYVTQHRIL